jgi:PAS domain S-box-containing protein
MGSMAITDVAEALRPEDRSQEIVDEFDEGFVSFDSELCVTECNSVAERLFKLKREDLLGRKLWRVAGLASTSPFGALVRRAAAAHAIENAELTYRCTGSARQLAVHAFPLEGGIAAIWRDITEARAAERRLAQSEARYREIGDGLPMAAWLSRANGKLEFINQAMADALGRPRSALLGDGWIGCIDPEDRASLLQARDDARENHGSVHYEGRFRRPDGELRIIQLYGRPRFDSDGAFRGHVGIAADVTERRHAEHRQRLLINELNHRVKNTLAIVQSLVRHTLRDHAAPDVLEEAVTDRLLALSAAHDVLNREHWTGANVADIARELMRPFGHGGRVSLNGPEARVSPKSAIAISMALMELATNASKHGALTTPQGRIELSWRPREGRVLLEWRETGGPRVDSPRFSGFGATVLGRMLAVELGRPAELVYAPEGLICRLDAPETPKAEPTMVDPG